MIYLIHPDTDETCACEGEGTAKEAERLGFRRVSYQEYEAAWAERDRARRVDMAVEDAEEEKWAKKRRDKGIY